jgi:outer membrane protein OmpA-like peptidoglycan-associated protein
MTVTVTTMMSGNIGTANMARYEPLRGRGLRPTRLWFVLAAVVSFVLLAGSHHVHAQVQPTETEILQSLMKQRLMRCPVGASKASCGDPSRSPFELDVFDVFFDYGSAALDRQAGAILVALAAELNKSENASRTFLIGGHADAAGGEFRNQVLSERRAKMVKRFLVERCGVDGSKLLTAGFGKQLPKNMADPYAEENRRVDINALSAIHERESER